MQVQLKNKSFGHRIGYRLLQNEINSGTQYLFMIRNIYCVHEICQNYCRDAWHTSQILRFLLIIIQETCSQEKHAMRLYGSI